MIAGASIAAQKSKTLQIPGGLKCSRRQAPIKQPLPLAVGSVLGEKYDWSASIEKQILTLSPQSEVTCETEVCHVGEHPGGTWRKEL